MTTPAQNLYADIQPYVRPRHVPVEPVVFAALVVAVVCSVSLWKPAQAELQQAAPAQQSETVAVAPQS